MQRQKKTKKNSGTGIFHQAYQRFLKIHGNPHEIAAGLALGLFVAMSPFIGIHMAMAVFFAALLKWNKISAVAGVWLSNPLTMPALYSATWFVGSKITGVKLAENIPHSLNLKATYAFLLKTPSLITTLTVGGIVVGIPLSLAVYIVSLGLLQRYQEEVKEKLKNRKTRRKKKKKARKKKKKNRRRR